MLLKLRSQANRSTWCFSDSLTPDRLPHLEVDLPARILGVLMALAGLGWMIFFPAARKPAVSLHSALGFVAELLLLLWLLVKGVDVQRWREQAGLRGMTTVASENNVGG